MFSSRLAYVPLVNNTPTRVLSRSDKRYRVVLTSNIFGITSVSIIYLGQDSTVSTTTGFPMPNGNPSVDWCVREYGYVVQSEVWALCPTGTIVMGVLEVMACDCESQAMLRDALGHSAGDKDWHLRHAVQAQGGYGRGEKGAR